MEESKQLEATRIELLCKLPQVTDLDGLCDLACRIMGNPMFISDLAHTIIAYTKCVEVNDPVWQENIVQSRLERTTVNQDREVSVAHGVSAVERRPVLIEDNYLPYPRIIKLLTHKGQPMGVMVITAYLAPFGASDIDLAELISSFVVPRMIDSRFFASDNAQTVENYFIRLLSGVRFSPERVEKRLDILGYRRRAYTYVLSIRPRGGDDNRGRTGVGPLLDRLRTLGACRAFLYDTSLVCVWESDEDMVDWAAQKPALAALLREESLAAGVSRRIGSLHELSDYYQQAQAAVDFGLRLGRLDCFLYFDTLSSFMMFGQLPPGKLLQCCHQRIAELSAYDAAHGTELCATLQVYLEQAKSLAKTAELLFIHRNTVRYRIRRCMELMNTDFENGNDIFSFILSLRILEYQKKLTTDREPAGATP